MSDDDFPNRLIPLAVSQSRFVLPRAGRACAKGGFNRDAISIAAGDRLQSQKQHYGQAVSAGRGIVMTVLLANDQWLLVDGRVIKSSVIAVGELRDDLIG